MRFNNRHTQIRPPGVKAAAVYAVYINVLIYLLFAIVFIYGRNAIIPMDDARPPHPPPSAWMIAFGALTLYLYLFVLFAVNFYALSRKGLPSRAKTWVAILLSLICMILMNRLFWWLQNSLVVFPEPDFRAVRGAMVKDFVLGGFAVFTAQLIYANYRRQVVTLENEALKAEYERARYETLKSQIDPHFLFNTLNTLNSVVVKDPEKGQRYIQKLSSIFRYTIHTRDVTTLADEISFTKNYCELMSIRYGENLEFDFRLLPEYDSCSVVPFSIQTLVENAIKHNVITRKQKLKVTIRTDSDGFITVCNPLNPKNEPEAGEGVGLANLSERYRLKWNRDIEIHNDGQNFTVRLPLIRETPNQKGANE